MEFLIAGLPASGAIVALVEGAKRLGVPARWAPLLAVALGLACGVAAHVAAVVPEARGWYEAAGSGILVGLSAAGLYSGVKAVVPPQKSAGTDSA